MIILLFVLVFLAAAIVDNKLFNVHAKFVLAVLMLSIAFVECIRLESGTDYWNYFGYFHSDFETGVQVYVYEPLYGAIVYAFKSVTDKFYIFDFFYFVLLYALYYFSLPKITNKYLTAFFLFFCITIGYFGSNRQLMALAITFFAAVYFLPKEKLFFTLWIFVACLFHYSAFVALLYLFLDRSFSTKTYFFVFIFFILLLFSGLNRNIVELFSFISYLKGNYPYYFRETYLNLQGKQLLMSLLGVIRKLIPIAVLLYYKTDFATRRHYLLFLNISFLSLYFYLFSLNNIPVLNSRLSLYFIIYEAVVLSWLAGILTKPKQKMFAYTILGIYGFAIFIKGIGMYPHLFIPYKNILFTF